MNTIMNYISIFYTVNEREEAIDFESDIDLEGLWKAMETQVEEGKVKSIGLSNFNKAQIERIRKSM